MTRPAGHSLWLRLMGIFLGVIVVGVVVMVVSVRLSTAAHLRRRVLSDDVAQANALAPALASYYAQQGDWNGVETLLASAPSVAPAQAPPTPASGMSDMMGSGMGPSMMWNWQQWFQVTRTTGPIVDRIVVLDAAGRIIADTGGASTGERHPPAHLKDGVPIVDTNNQTVGTVLVGSMIEPVLNPADEDFLRSVNFSIFVTSVAVGLLALVLGSLLFRRIMAPLGALSRAAERIAAGDLRPRIAVLSDDELGRVARSFNRMAEGLAQADVQRRNLIADIAHELRTPLTVVQGNLEALMDGVYDLTPENVAGVHRQTLVLSRLVGDLRDLALAEAGQLRLDWKPVALQAIIEQVSTGLEAQAREKGVTVKVERAEALPMVEADEQRLAQVLFNLISNALRHTPSGGTVTVSAEQRDGRLVVGVRDTGTGIAPEDLPHVFERFYRADRSRARSTGGSGLGLTIAKQIVEAHSGQIWAQSWLGAGSTFMFSLPLSGARPAPAAASVQHPLAPTPEGSARAITCPRCGRVTEPGWQWCAYCGEDLSRVVSSHSAGMHP